VSDPASTSSPGSSNAAACGRWWLAGLVHAAILYVALPPVGWWWLVFAAPAPLAMVAVGAARRRTVIACLGVPMIGAWLLHQWWVGSVSALGLPPMACYLAAWTAIMGLAVRRVARSPRFASLPLAILLPPVWLFVEWLRADVVFDGYPWYLLGQPLVEWVPLAQVADVGGVMFVSLLPAAIGGLLADHGLRRGSAGTRRVASIGVAMFAAVWTAYGFWRISTAPAIPGPTVLAIQTNLPQSNKVGWAPADQWRDANEFATRTVDAVRAADSAGTPIDLVAWPETMLPGVGLEPASTGFMKSAGWWPGERFADLVSQLQSIVARPLLLGSASFDGLRLAKDGERLDWDARHNSVYLVDGDDPASLVRYDKIFLTPFGETMPYISAWPWLESKLLDLGARGMQFDLEPGTSPVRFEIAWTPREGESASIGVATPICFEDTVPAVCRELVWDGDRKAVDLLVNASNDGWFGDWPGPREVHLQLARFRCIENRVPMVRAVNTGRSASVDALGRLIDVLPALEPGVLIAPVTLDGRHSPYASLGRWPVLLVSLAGVLLVLGGRGQRRAKAAAESSDAA
jgi:apolipoprotein N-acyltransferase